MKKRRSSVVGFTGTRKGMTQSQATAVKLIIRKRAKGLEVHHGDCIGADANFHAICLSQRVPTIIVHPPKEDKHRAFCCPTKPKHSREPKDYLKRNHAIVDESGLLIATPKEYREVKRSGTWATIRYALKKNRRIIVILPDGKVIRLNFKLPDGKVIRLNFKLIKIGGKWYG